MSEKNTGVDVKAELEQLRARLEASEKALSEAKAEREAASQLGKLDRLFVHIRVVNTKNGQRCVGNFQLRTAAGYVDVGEKLTFWGDPDGEGVKASMIAFLKQTAATVQGATIRDYTKPRAPKAQAATPATGQEVGAEPKGAAAADEGLPE